VKAKYRKRPVVIEAIQFDGKNWDEVQLAFPAMDTITTPCGQRRICTLEGDHDVTTGDFIIQGVKGEYYPCKPDIFDATYEKVTKY
jgi:hypothetical protein